MSNKLRISEIFYSLQGETRTSGIPCVFVRLTGCPLRCVWCDTDYAFSGGKIMTFAEITDKIAEYNPHYITVTGGEPLAQKNCLPFLTRLADMEYIVSLETSGALPLDEVDQRVVKVMDLKPPSSGETSKNRYENIKLLNRNDQVKFVIGDRNDYDWSVSQLIIHQLDSKVSDVLFSPVADKLEPRMLADWIVKDRLPVRFQLQLHKILWGNVTGV